MTPDLERLGLFYDRIPPGLTPAQLAKLKALTRGLPRERAAVQQAAA